MSWVLVMVIGLPTAAEESTVRHDDPDEEFDTFLGDALATVEALPLEERAKKLDQLASTLFEQAARKRAELFVLPLTPLPATKGIDVDAEFSFTISPNGQELLFLADDDFISTSRLVVLNLARNTVREHQITYDANHYSPRWDLTNDCWSKDSRFCMGPVPGAKEGAYVDSPSFVIDLSDPERLRVTHVLEPHDEMAAFWFGDFKEPFSCSDCYPGYPGYWPGSESRDEGDEPRVSGPDEYRIYEVRTFGNAEAAVYARDLAWDLATSREQELVRFGSKRGVDIDRLRVSLSGRYLAFQVNYGSGVVWPTLYIVDVTTRAVIPVAENVFYDVHWTANPDRLYFYKKCRPETGEACEELGNHLYSVQP